MCWWLYILLYTFFKYLQIVPLKFIYVCIYLIIYFILYTILYVSCISINILKYILFFKNFSYIVFPLYLSLSLFHIHAFPVFFPFHLPNFFSHNIQQNMWTVNIVFNFYAPKHFKNKSQMKLPIKWKSVFTHDNYLHLNFQDLKYQVDTMESS